MPGATPVPTSGLLPSPPMADQSQTPQPTPAAHDAAYAPTQHVGQPAPGSQQTYDQAAAQQVYAPPPGFGPPPGFSQPAESSSVKIGAPMLYSAISVVAIVLAVSLKEDGRNGWDDIGVWSGFAIAAAAATMAPSLRSNLSMGVSRAWQVGLGGAVGLAAYWILFVLPAIERNVSFLATVGVVAGGLAVWLAPGRPDAPADGAGQTW